MNAKTYFVLRATTEGTRTVPYKFDVTPRNIAREVERANNALHFATKQARRQRHGKRWDYETYKLLLEARRERERVTGNPEHGPLGFAP